MDLLLISFISFCAGYIVGMIVGHLFCTHRIINQEDEQNSWQNDVSPLYHMRDQSKE